MVQPTQSSISPNLELWIIGWAYPITSFLMLCFKVVDVLDLAWLVLLALVIPVLAVGAVIVRRMTGTRYSWFSILVFAVWMGIIAYALFWVFASASASV